MRLYHLARWLSCLTLVGLLLLLRRRTRSHLPSDAILSGQQQLEQCRVPRVVHQTWKTTKVDGKFRHNVRSWLLRNPGWRYKFWTDAQMRQLVALKYPEHLAMYDAFPSPIMRADAFRLFVLHAEGGIYADLDFEALRPLDTLLARAHAEGHGVLLGQEPLAHAHALYDIPRMMCNAIMGSCAQHPFWRTAMAEVRRRAVEQGVKTVRATGPKMLTAAVATAQAMARSSGWMPRFGSVYVAPATMFYPFFDDGNVGATNMRSKCAGRDLSPRREHACSRLSALHFRNEALSSFVADGDTVPALAAAATDEADAVEEDNTAAADWGKGVRARPFAVHHWSHTWLGGYMGGSTFDVVSFTAAVGRAAVACATRGKKLCPALAPGDRRFPRCVRHAARAAGVPVPDSCRKAWGKNGNGL